MDSSPLLLGTERADLQGHRGNSWVAGVGLEGSPSKQAPFPAAEPGPILIPSCPNVGKEKSPFSPLGLGGL